MAESDSSILADVVGRALRTPALMRAPLWVYRAGLGFLFGSRILMLEQVGRRTGLRRYVVLEVVEHPSPDTYVVPSGFGERSQWFRNVMARPDVRISVSRRRSVAATARRLSASEADAALGRYIDRHHRAWAALKGVLEDTLGKRVEPPGTELPLIELVVK